MKISEGKTVMAKRQDLNMLRRQYLSAKILGLLVSMMALLSLSTQSLAAALESVGYSSLPGEKARQK